MEEKEKNKVEEETSNTFNGLWSLVEGIFGFLLWLGFVIVVLLVLRAFVRFLIY